MWPYTDTEQNWLACDPQASETQPRPGIRGRGGSIDPVPEVVLRHGQEHIYRLAEAIAAAIVDTASFIGHRFGRSRSTTPAATPADLCEELRQPLTSIRSAAEILRDNPTLAPDQRARMLGVIVSESERLDRLIDVARVPA